RHVVVDSAQAVCGGIPNDFVEVILALASKQRDAERRRFLQFGRHLGQHGKATRNVKATDYDIDACLPQQTCDVDGTRKLIRLDADKTNEAKALIAPELPDDCRNSNACVGLIYRPHRDLDTGAEHSSLCSAKSKPIEHRERVRRHRRSQPTNDIALLVVVRWLDKQDVKPAASRCNRALRVHSSSRSNEL